MTGLLVMACGLHSLLLGVFLFLFVRLQVRAEERNQH